MGGSWRDLWPVSVSTAWDWADGHRILRSVAPCQQGQLHRVLEAGPPTKADGLSLPSEDLSKVPAQLFPETTAIADLLSTCHLDTCALSHRTVYNSGPQPSGHQGPISWEVIFPWSSHGEGVVVVVVSG